MNPRHLTCLVLCDENREKALLLKRSATKSVLPNLYTGLGGKTEEGETPEQCLLRECREEASQIDWTHAVTDLTYRLILHDQVSRAPEYNIIHWFTGILRQELTDMSSTEGILEWFRITNLPLRQERMTHPAYAAVPHILHLIDKAPATYEADLYYHRKEPRLDLY